MWRIRKRGKHPAKLKDGKARGYLAVGGEAVGFFTTETQRHGEEIGPEIGMRPWFPTLSQTARKDGAPLLAAVPSKVQKPGPISPFRILPSSEVLSRRVSASFDARWPRSLASMIWVSTSAREPRAVFRKW